MSEGIRKITDDTTEFVGNLPLNLANGAEKGAKLASKAVIDGTRSRIGMVYHYGVKYPFKTGGDALKDALDLVTLKNWNPLKMRTWTNAWDLISLNSLSTKVGDLVQFTVPFAGKHLRKLPSTAIGWLKGNGGSSDFSLKNSAFGGGDATPSAA